MRILREYKITANGSFVLGGGFSTMPVRNHRLGLLVPVLSFMLGLLFGEIAIRLISGDWREGEIFNSKPLVPRNWNKVAHFYRNLLDERSVDPPFMVYDDVMGWTVGPNRRSKDGMDWSSSEGIRAPHGGVSFSAMTQKTVIAVVGDSFAFGQEVPYEQSWAYLLEKALGPDYKVLNFGVAGYGLDQAYLRYEKDVRKWKPKIVIFGIISHDLVRSMVVYPFIDLPLWDSPFSKPRFVVREGELNKLNVPPITPEAIFSRRSIAELPFVEFDRGYNESDWQNSWYHRSYLIRLFLSVFPGWSIHNQDTSEEAIVSVNALILKHFVRSAAERQTVPLVVYFPYEPEFDERTLSVEIGKRTLDKSGVAYTDLTPCLQKLEPADRLIPFGRHYSPKGNAMVAHCLRDVVQNSLDANSGGIHEVPEY